MGFLPFGGFVFSIDGGNYVGTNKGIDDDKFREIAKILGIPKADIDQLIAHKPRSVYLYRGTPVMPFVPTLVGCGGGGCGGGGGGGGGSGGSGSSGGE